MSDFENRLTATKQKKFVDIIPPSKRRVDLWPRVQKSGRNVNVAAPASPSHLFEKDSSKKIGSVERASFLKKVIKTKKGGARRSFLFSILRDRLNGFLVWQKTISKTSKNIGDKQKFFGGGKTVSLGRIGIGIGGLFLIGAGAWGYFELPRVKIVLYSMVLEHEVEIPFEGRTNAAQINFEKGVLPLELLSFALREEREFLSSGVEERIEKSRGTITVFNAYSSEPQILVGRTRFISEDGHLFRSIKKVTIPGAKVEGGTITPSSYDIEVEAAEAGSEYNIGPSAFSIPGFAGTPRYLGFYGKSKIAMAGGFVGEVEVIKSEDLERAKKELETALSQKVQGELLKKLPAGFEVLGSVAKNAEAADFSKKAAESGKIFIADVSMSIKAFIIRSSDLADFIERSVAKSIPQFMEEVKQARRVTQSVDRIDIGKGNTQGSIDVSTKVAHQFNQDEFRNAIKGKESEEVRTVLTNDPRVKKAVVSFWPMWAKRVPDNSGKIKIEVASPEE